MKHTFSLALAAALVAAFPMAHAQSASPVIYPAKGQPPAQLQQGQQGQARAQARSVYERGFAACLEARGYVVK